MNRRTIFFALGLPALAALTFTVAACGGGGGSSTPAPTVPVGALPVIAGPGLVLDKGEYSIAATAGQVTIAYVQHDTQRHTLVVRDANGVIQGTKLEIIKNGDISVGTFALAPGSYTVNCDVPGHGPMKAKLIVT